MLDQYYLWKKNREGKIPVTGGEIPLTARMAIFSRGQLPHSFKIEEGNGGLAPSASREAKPPTYYIDSASSGLPTRSLQHQDQKLEPIIDYLEEGDRLISDLPGEYWDEYQSNGEPPIIEGYECIGVTPEDCDWSYVGLEPVYRESSTVVEREDPAGEICSNEDTEENRDEDDWLLPEEVELFEIDEDPIDRILREREERERYDSRFSKSGRHKKEIRGSDGISRTYWVKPQARVATSRQNRQELNQARRTKEARERIEAINLLEKSVTGFVKESFRDDFAMMPLEAQKAIADSVNKLNRRTGEDYEIVDANRSKGFVTASGDYGNCYSIGFQGGKKIVLSSEKRQLDVELDHPEFGDWRVEIEASHVAFTVNDSYTTDEPRKGDPFERKRNAVVAGAVKEMWKSQLENHFEDGEVVFCSAARGDIEERGESREAIYKRMGFSDEVDGQEELVAVVDRTKRKGLNSDPYQIEDGIKDLVAEQEYERKQQEEKENEELRDEEYEARSEELWSSASRFSAIFSDTADDFAREYVERKKQEPSIPGLEDLHNSNFLAFKDKDLEELSDLKDELSDIWSDLDSFEMEFGDRPFDKGDVFGEIFNHVDIAHTISQIKDASSKNKQVEMLGYVNAHIKLSAGLLPGSYLSAWDTFDNSPELQRYIDEIKKARERLTEMGGRLDNSIPRESRQDAIPRKYAHIDFTPPESVRRAAERGLEIRAKQPKSKRGGLTNNEAAKEGIGSGVQRAVNLKNGDRLSPKVVRQMKDFFTRFAHLKGKIKQEPEGKMSQSWLQWGGDTGVTWSNKVVAQMEAADKKERQDAIARFNKKHNDSLTEETLLRQDSLSPVYEWVEGYNRGDSWVPGYVRYYRDRSGSPKKKDPLNLDAKEEDDPLAPAVEVGVGRSQGVIDQWIEILQGAIVQGGSYEEILDNLPELVKKLPLDDLGQIIQEGNIVGHLIGLSENEAT